MLRILFAILIAAAWLDAHAQSAPPLQPIPRDGTCPSGYYASDKHCIAATDSAEAVIPRAGSCPAGWYANGNYCVSTK
ncbi:MAG: hypothetical protein FJ179_04905 [Gammaproteobacteria bacterium]|nr:hypothetical protein [Gammaproteobacteria bacterium]